MNLAIWLFANWLFGPNLPPAEQRDSFAAVPPPTFDHISSRYANVFWLSVSAVPGATVRFTTSGLEPTASSPVFDVPRLMAERTTVRAKAFMDGRPPSATTTGHFVVDVPRRTAAAALHVVPTTHRDDPEGFRQACLRMDLWPDVLARTLYFGSTMGIAALSDAELSSCFKAMAKNRLQLTIEAGVINDDVPDGAALAAIDAPQLRRFIRLGAPLSTLYMQEPWTSVSGSTLTYAEVVAETAEWMSLIRRQFPGIRLVLQEAYPFRAADALITFVRDVNAAAAARGSGKLDGFELDHDWNIAAWSVTDVYRINAAVRADGLLFSIIIWPAGQPTLDDCAFGRRISRQFRDLYAAGSAQFGQDFTPDVWSIESWSPIPSGIVPETGACTFMQGARDIAMGL